MRSILHGNGPRQSESHAHRISLLGRLCHVTQRAVVGGVVATALVTLTLFAPQVGVSQAQHQPLLAIHAFGPCPGYGSPC